MNYLFVLNDPPYGTERSYNGLRLGLSLRKQEGVNLKIFLLGDAVGCAKVGQKTPEGSYNLGRMLKGFTSRGIPVGASRTGTRQRCCSRRTGCGAGSRGRRKHRRAIEHRLTPTE